MTIPPGLYSTYAASNHDIQTHARFAAFDEQSTPVKVFVFNAETYTVEGVQANPIKSRSENEDECNYVAEYIGPTTTTDIECTSVIFYHLDEFDGLCMQERISGDDYEDAVEEGEIPQLPSFVRFYILSELHELCHWAVDANEQPADSGHSKIWNAVLTDAIEYAAGDMEADPDFSYDFASAQEEEPVRVPDLSISTPETHDGCKQRDLSTLDESTQEGE